MVSGLLTCVVVLSWFAADWARLDTGRPVWSAIKYYSLRTICFVTLTFYILWVLF